MCKTERTLLMEATLIEWFKENFNMDMKTEYRLSTGGIVDLAGVWYDPRRSDIKDIIFVEIKQSKQDLKYGHGKNFVGLSNYLAVPTELVGEALVWLRDTCDDWRTGVIEITKSWKTRIVKYPMLEYKNTIVEDKELIDKIMFDHCGALTPHIYRALDWKEEMNG